MVVVSSILAKCDIFLLAVVFVIFDGYSFFIDLFMSICTTYVADVSAEL